jgi:hypothetical protein
MRYHDAQSQVRRALADGNFVAANSLLSIFPVRPPPHEGAQAQHFPGMTEQKPGRPVYAFILTKKQEFSFEPPPKTRNL